MVTCTQMRPDGICLYEMENDDLHVVVSSYGVTIMELAMKGNDGSWHNLILSYPSIEDYMAKSGTYFGAIVGRSANRLAKGQFTLNGKTYQLPINNGPNSLHGGLNGFSYQNFGSKIEEDQLTFIYHSLDMEEGYPGNLMVWVTLKLEDSSLRIIYDALSDQDTLCSLTHHLYFNLSYEDTIDHHLLQVGALRHGLVDQDGLCIGQFREVQGTPLDFSKLSFVQQGYDQSDWQIQNANGIDHHFVFEKGLPQVMLVDPFSKRTLLIETTFPGVQLYSANYLTPYFDRFKGTLGYHAGLAIEPQIVPDSIHNQEHPEVILRAGNHYHQEICYHFYSQPDLAFAGNCLNQDSLGDRYNPLDFIAKSRDSKSLLYEKNPLSKER